MNETKQLDSLEALDALGAFWRADWSGFDGRTLRSQLQDIRGLIVRELNGEQVDIAEYIGEYLTPEEW